MTQGFYEQLGVAPDAEPDRIKAAYGRAVSHLLRRREATVSQGGDAGPLDLARAQLDEAWSVLSDPARRRRYDAMLAVAGDGSVPRDLDGLWTRVAGAMIHPSVAAAARLVDATTGLRLAPLPEPPRPVVSRRVAEAFDESPPTDAGVGGGSVLTFGARRAVGPRPVEARPEPAEPAPEVRAPAAEVRPWTPPPPPAPAPPPAAPAPPPPVTVAVPAPAPPKLTVAVAAAPAVVGGTSGAHLRAAREARGLSVAEMSETTRISVRYLEAIEAEDYGSLPAAAAFVRGYVREMARMLDLDVERVVAGYMRRFSGDG